MLIVEATSYLKNICLYSLCNKCAALPIQCDYFIKNSSSLYLKLGKLVREVIVRGREFQIFGPW